MEDDDEDLPMAALPRPTAKEPTQLSVDDLVYGDDRLETIFFLMTLDELMALVAEQYQGLKRGWRQNRAKGWPGHTIIEHLMELAVAVNFAIQEVAYLEQKLAADHPQMNTLYRVMHAIVVFPVMAEELTQTVKGSSPLASEFQETGAFAFWGDCLEIGFRNVHSNRGKTL
jgi:hypothetical protein